MFLHPKFNFTKISFLIVIGYLSFINLFVIKTTPEILAIQFAVVSVIFKKIFSNKFGGFFKLWLPFIGLFMLYEFLRGFVDDISPFKDITLFWIYNIEYFFFNPIPSVFLQKLISESGLLNYFAIFFYSSFFYFSFLVAYVIWFIDKKKFVDYSIRFLGLTYLGLLIFFILPTAPPWMASEAFNLGVQRYVYQSALLKSFKTFVLYKYFVYGNPIAAFPSLHTAWPAFSSLFILKKFKKTFFSYLLLVFPIMIGFSVVLSGEHFLFDIIASWVLAYLVVYTKLPKKVKELTGLK